MLNELKRFWAGSKPVTKAEAIEANVETTGTTAPAKQEEETMTQQEQPNLAATEALEMVATLTSANEALTAQFAEVTAKLEAATATLAEIETAKAALVAEAKATKLEARKQKVEAAIGTEKAASVLLATETLSDEQFSAVVGAMETSLATEATTALFQEKGAEAKADAAPTHFNKFIKK